MINKNKDKYQNINGILYKKEAPGNVIKALENARENGIRISIVYGDIVTGKVWNNGTPMLGYVGKNSNNLPILLFGKNSIGGECIMDSSILSIKEVKNNNIIYQSSFDESLIVEEKLIEKICNEVDVNTSIC